MRTIARLFYFLRESMLTKLENTINCGEIINKTKKYIYK